MIRQITLEDFEQLFEIWKTGLNETFEAGTLDFAGNEEFYKNSFIEKIKGQDDNFKIWGYFDGAELLAWASILPCHPSPTISRNYGEISVYVKSGLWDKGIGNQISAHAMDYARDKTSIYYVLGIVSEKNERIKKVAAEMGMKKIGDLPRSAKDKHNPNFSYWQVAL